MIAAAILTHNAVRNERTALLRDTVASLAAEADTVAIIDNGSTDATGDYVDDLAAEHGCEIVRNRSRITTSGAGTNLQGAWCDATDADLCVLSDDDMMWRPGWARQLREWWARADDSVILTGCHLEPSYAWNIITGRNGGALYRESTGAASWTFRRGTWGIIGPVPRRRQGWSDVPACMRLRAHGWTIAQLDIAEHRGISTWGNGASTFDAQQVARVRELLQEAN